MEGKLNEQTVNLIKSFKNGDVSLKGFLGTTAGAIIKFSALVAACYGAYKIFDYYIVTAKEYQEKIDGITESLEGLQSEYDALKSKSSDELTEGKKEHLKYLDRLDKAE